MTAHVLTGSSKEEECAKGPSEDQQSAEMLEQAADIPPPPALVVDHQRLEVRRQQLHFRSNYRQNILIRFSRCIKDPPTEGQTACVQRCHKRSDSAHFINPDELLPASGCCVKPANQIGVCQIKVPLSGDPVELFRTTVLLTKFVFQLKALSRSFAFGREFASSQIRSQKGKSLQSFNSF